MFEKARLLFDDPIDRQPDISGLVRAVESLRKDDQLRVLRLIELLASMPECAQSTHVRHVLRMLSGLRLLSRQECRYRLDTAINCLEEERDDSFADLDIEGAVFETH